jgi:hypothetical protein
MIAWVTNGLSDRTLVRDLASLILSSDFFARSPAGEIFRYEKGGYAPGGEFLIRQRVKHLLLDLRKAEKWTRKLAREVTEFIVLDTPELEAMPSSDFINLENGILDVWTGKLIPHSPKLLSTIRIPVAFDAQASCPRIEGFIGEVFRKDSTQLAREILGDLVTSDRSIQKATCLVGEGGSVCERSGIGIQSHLIDRAGRPGLEMVEPLGEAIPQIYRFDRPPMMFVHSASVCNPLFEDCVSRGRGERRPVYRVVSERPQATAEMDKRT